MKKLKIGKSQIHGRGLFSGEPIKKGELIAKVHSGIQMDPQTIKYMPTQFGRFYNHDEKGFNSRNEIIGNHRYLRAIKAIPANTEITANYREHSEMEQPEDFGSGKYASFDFDKTIATEEGLAKARQMLRDGYNLFIVSARDKVTPDMVARARQAGIPEENIIATGSDNAKVRKVKQLGVEKHFDDKPEVIAALGSVGEQFKKGGGVNSKKYTRSIFGKNKLFVKNNLFKTKKVKNRIYDPNAKYFDNGGIIENNPDAPWNPDYPQPTTYEFQTLSPEEIAARNKFQQECTEDQPCYETDQIQAYLNQGMDFPRKNVGLMWDVVDDVNNPNSKYYHNAKAKWKQMGLPQTLGQRLNMNDPSNCMWAAGSGWQCLSDTRDEFKTLPLSAFESNDKFINAVNKGTIPFDRVTVTSDRNFDSPNKNILRAGDILNLKGPGVSHAITFSHYREDGTPIYLDSNGNPMDFNWNEGIWSELKPGYGNKAYISRFSPEKFYQDKIDILEEKARTNPTYYKDGGSSFGPPEEFYKNWYKNRVMPTPEGQKLLEKIRPEALERASQNVPYIYSEELNPDEAGYYDTETQQILLNKFLPEAQIEATKQHEFGHHIQAGDKFYDVLGKPHQYLVEQNIIGPKEINTGNPEWDKNLKKNYDDITNPDEIHARIMTLRNECGFKPDQVITEKDIEDCFKRKKEAGEALDPDIEDLKGVTKGNQSIVNLLNDMVSVPTSQDDMLYAKNGGAIEIEIDESDIDKYVKGGYIVEDISVPSLTRMDDGGTNTCPPDYYWNGQTCVTRTYTEIDPRYIAEHPDEARRIQNEGEVIVSRPASDIAKFRDEWKRNNPRDQWLDEKKRYYLNTLSNKGLNKLAGVNMSYFPAKVRQNYLDEYEYLANTYAIEKIGDKRGFNPKRRGEWVDQLSEGEKNAMAQSKYGSKLQPSYWSRSLAGLQELGNEAIKLLPGEQGDVMKFNIPGLTKKEQKEIRESKLGALETLAPMDIPGAAIANLAKNTGLSTGSDYKEQANALAGEKMANVTDIDALALNPLTYAGLEALPELGINLVRGIGKGVTMAPETLSNLAKFVKTEGSPKLKQFFDRPPGPLMIGLGSGAKSTKQAPLFKSEIDWVDWVKKHNKNYDAEDIQNIIKNSEEYNIIEQQTKANGTWMKNADGSPFQGTPEQFIQSQSTKFKQAYPEGYEITYRGGDKRDAVKSDWSDKSNVVFTTKDEYGARAYNKTLDQPPLSSTEAPPEGISQLYMPKTSNKIVIDGNEYPVGHKYRSHGLPYTNDAGKLVYSPGSRTNYARLNAIDQVPANELEAKNLEAFKTWMLETHPTMTERGWRGEPRILNDWVMTDHFASFLNSPAGRNIDRVEFQKIMDGTLEPIDVEVHNLNEAQQLKSMWGNSGEFDLTNPSKFKALLPYLIPTGLGVGAASQMQGQESNEGYSKGGVFELRNKTTTKMYNGGTNPCPPDHYWNGEACVPTGRTFTPIDPNYIAEHPDEARYILNEGEVEVNPPKERVPLMMQFSNEFQENNPYDAYYEKAAYDYLKKSKKNWDDALGINIHNLPENVAKRIQNNYYKDLEKYVINKSKKTQKEYMGKFDKKGNWIPLNGIHNHYLFKHNILDPLSKRPTGHGSWDNYGDGSIQMVYPEQFFMGPGAGILGLTGRAAAKGISNLAKSSLVQGTKAALSQPIANIPGLTVGNAIASGFAADAVVNRFPEVPSQIAEGNYSSALENALTGTLDIAGANMMSPLLKGIGKGVSATPEAISNLGKFITTETPLKNTYKINPFAFKSNPKAYYRGIGKSGLDDALQSGVFRQAGFDDKNYNNYKEVWYATGDRGFAKARDFSKNYIAEVPRSAFPETGDQFFGSSIMPTRGTKKHIPITEGRILQKDWLRGYKEVPIELPGSPNTTSSPDNLQKASFLNPLALLDRIIPRPPSPTILLGMEDDVVNWSPLNKVPFYGNKLAEKGFTYPKNSRNTDITAYRKFGNSLDDVRKSKTFKPAGGFRMGAKQIESEGNWAEAGIPNENYKGVFAAGMDPRVPGTNIKLEYWNKRNGVVGMTKDRNPAIPVNDPGLQFHRRLPFSNRYVPIDKQKLMDNKFQLATELPHLQSLIEKYGIAAAYAAALGAMGFDTPQQYLNEYVNDPIMKEYNKYIKPSVDTIYNNAFRPIKIDRQTKSRTIEGYSKGGTYKLGDEVDDATMKQLKKLGYTFKKI